MEFPEVDFPDGVYADVRYERVASTMVTIRDGSLEDATARSTTGAFLRVRKGGRWLYASTTDLGSISARLAAMARSTALPAVKGAPDVESQLVAHKAQDRRIEGRVVSSIPIAEKIDLLRSQMGVMQRPTVRSWGAIFLDTHRARRFVSSKGADVRREHQVAGWGWQFALAEGTRTWSDRAEGGGESFEELAASLARLPSHVEHSEEFMRHAEALEPGPRTVVLAPPVAGVFAHESFGHKSEADFMLGDPNMLEEWRIGKPVGSPILSIADDGTLPGPGYTPYDDEGQRAERTWLVKDGQLMGRLHSAETAAALGESRSRNARAMDFTFEPMVRMTTTFIAPGSSTKEEVFSGVDDGIFIERCRHGSGMSTFTIAPSLAWRIRGGKIAEPVRVNVITGSVFETLGLIDGLSDELELHRAVLGGCGKMEQYPLPVAFGGPYVRVSRMMVA
jgi:TldD protein